MKKSSLFKKQGKRFLASVLLLGLVFSTGAHVGSVPNKVMAAEGEVYDEVATCHDFIDSVGVASKTYDLTAPNFVYDQNVGGTSNTAIKFRYQYPGETVPESGNVLWFYMNNTGNGNDNTGYIFELKWGGSKRLVVNIHKQMSDFWFTWNYTGALDSEFDVEFGVVQVKDAVGTFIGYSPYAKVNGAIVAQKTDLDTTRVMGQRAYMMLKSAATLSCTEVYDDVATYHDFIDSVGEVSKTYDLTNPNFIYDWGLGGTSNTAIKFRYQYPGETVPENGNVMMFYMNNTGNFVDNTGYIFELKWGGLKRLIVNIHKQASDFWSTWNYTGALDSEFDVEIGVVQVKESGKLIGYRPYAKVNGAIVAAKKDLDTTRMMGQYAGVMLKSAATLSSTEMKLNAVTDSVVTGGETEPDYLEGYQFAGYYTTYTGDTAVKTGERVPVAKGQTVDTATTPVYAKYIPNDVLTVKAQNGTADDTQVVRFISTVDSLDYKRVGFKMQLKDSTGAYLPVSTGSTVVDQSSNEVYKTLRAIGGDTVLPTVFSASSEYFFACTFTAIPSNYNGGTIEITPYYVTQDGTTVEGDVASFTIANGGVQ